MGQFLPGAVIDMAYRTENFCRRNCSLIQGKNWKHFYLSIIGVIVTTIKVES